jgi:uncharacterized protein (TIGR03083 family)
VTEFDKGAAYRGARERIGALVRAAGPDVDGRLVPANPGWTVHDVVAHVRGVAQDVINGNMAGAPGESWTAAHVERGRVKSTDVLLEEWADDAAILEEMLNSPDGARMGALVIDAHAHEQDLRGALERPGERTGPFVEWATSHLLGAFFAKVDGSGLAPVQVHTDTAVLGEPDAPVTLKATNWELFRAALGRRSPGQIASLDWSGSADPSVYLPHMIIFGPAAADVVE